jgi:hypothetical protein
VSLAPKLERQWAYWSEHKCRQFTRFGWGLAIAAVDRFIAGVPVEHCFTYEHAGMSADCQIALTRNRMFIAILSFKCGEPDGPDHDPNGGVTARPCAAAGLFLLLTGTHRNYRIVDLCGNVPQLVPYNVIHFIPRSGRFGFVLTIGGEMDNYRRDEAKRTVTGGIIHQTLLVKPRTTTIHLRKAIARHRNQLLSSASAFTKRPSQGLLGNLTRALRSSDLTAVHGGLALLAALFWSRIGDPIMPFREEDASRTRKSASKSALQLLAAPDAFALPGHARMHLGIKTDINISTPNFGFMTAFADCQIELENLISANVVALWARDGRQPDNHPP